jgi:DNA-3-methyladenine glycosylase
MNILSTSFFQRDALVVAPDLLGKYLVRGFDDGTVGRFRITEVEAYRGIEDKACHAAKGRTKRTEVLFHKGGKIYMYFIYGMYWMLNIVTGKDEEPQAILIRGIEGFSGPGKLTRHLQLNASFYGEELPSERIWLENNQEKIEYEQTPRVGIDYAGEWKEMPWRYIVKSEKSKTK